MDKAGKMVSDGFPFLRSYSYLPFGTIRSLTALAYVFVDL
jgi:hypothetical protein